jgi:hypothetical protein
MTKKIYITTFILSGIILASCNYGNNSPLENPLARVHDVYLYPSDLMEHFQPGLSDEDSVRVLKRMVDDWARNQLLLIQAETYLPEAEKDIKKQVEEYRSSLLIFKYTQYLLFKNIDTIVNENEIIDYYTRNTSNFILNSDVVKANYIKVPVTAPQINQLRTWCRLGDAHLEELNTYCNQHAEQYSLNADEWIRFNDLIAQTPLIIDNPGRYLTYNKNIEVSDSLHHYFIHILERVPEGQPSPIELVRRNIYTVIMNKRKLEYIQDMENTVYKDGLSRKQVEIYY